MSIVCCRYKKMTNFKTLNRIFDKKKKKNFKNLGLDSNFDAILTNSFINEHKKDSKKVHTFSFSFFFCVPWAVWVFYRILTNVRSFLYSFKNQKFLRICISSWFFESFLTAKNHSNNRLNSRGWLTKSKNRKSSLLLGKGVRKV